MANMSPKKNPIPEQDPNVRNKNFEEVALGYTVEMAVDEANRCLNCPRPACMSGCPVNVKIPQFIARVREGRGSRLVEDDQLFSGLIWTGARGKDLGLVDDLASTDHVAREVIGAEKIVNHTAKPDYLERLVDRFGIALGEGFSAVLGTTPGVR